MKPSPYFWVPLVFSLLQVWCSDDVVDEPRHQIAIAFNLDGLPVFQISHNVTTTPASVSASSLESSNETTPTTTFAPTEFNLFPSKHSQNSTVILDSAEITLNNETSTDAPVGGDNSETVTDEAEYYVADDDIAYDDYPTEYDEEEEDEEIEAKEYSNNSTSSSSHSSGDDPNKTSFEIVAESSLMPSNFSHETSNKTDNSTSVLLPTLSSRFRKVNLSEDEVNTENSKIINSSSPVYFALDDSSNGSSYGIRIFDPKTNRLRIQAASSTTTVVSTTEAPSAVEDTIENDIEEEDDANVVSSAEFDGASTLISVDDKGHDNNLLDVQNQTPRVIKIMKTLRNMAHLKLRSGKVNQSRLSGALRGKGKPLTNDLKEIQHSPSLTKANQKDETVQKKTSFTSKVGGHLKQQNSTLNASTSPPFKIPLKPTLKSLKTPIIYSPRPPVIVMNQMGKGPTTPKSVNATSAVTFTIADSDFASTTTTTDATQVRNKEEITTTVTTTNSPVTDGSPTEENQKSQDTPKLMTGVSTPSTPYHHPQSLHHPFLPKSPHNHAYAPTQDPFSSMDDDLSVEDFQDLHVANLMFGSKVGAKMPRPPPYVPRPRPPPPPFIPRLPPPPPKKKPTNMKKEQFASYEKVTVEMYGNDDVHHRKPPLHSRPFIESNYINKGSKPSPPPPPKVQLPPLPEPLYAASPHSNKPQHSPPQFNLRTTPPPTTTTVSTTTTTTTEKPTTRPVYTVERSRHVSHSPPSSSGSLPSLSQNVKDILPFYKEPGGIFKENKTHPVSHKNWYTAGHDNNIDQEPRPGVKYAPNLSHNSESQTVYASQLSKNEGNRPSNMKYYPPPQHSPYNDHYFHSPPQQYPFIPASAPAQPPPPPPPQMVVSHHIHHPQQQQQIFHHPQQPVLVAHVVPSGPTHGYVPLLHPPQPPPQAFMAPPTPINIQQHPQFVHQQNPYQISQNDLNKRMGEIADSDPFFGNPSPGSESKDDDLGEYDPELEAGIRDELNDLMEKNFKSAKIADSISLGPFNYGLDDDLHEEIRGRGNNAVRQGSENNTDISSSPHQPQQQQQPQQHQQPHQRPGIHDLGRIWQAASHAHQDFINAILQIDKIAPNVLPYPGNDQQNRKNAAPTTEESGETRENSPESQNNNDYESNDDEPEFDFGPEEHTMHTPEFEDFPEEDPDSTTHNTNHEDDDNIEFSIPSFIYDEDDSF